MKCSHIDCYRTNEQNEEKKTKLKNYYYVYIKFIYAFFIAVNVTIYSCYFY